MIKLNKPLVLVSILLLTILFTFSSLKKPTKPIQVFVPEFVLTYLDSFPKSKDNPITLAGVELGKALFFDKLLSADNTISCASCHQPQLAFADSLKFSRGIKSQEGIKNTPSIVNLAWANRFFWDGRAINLELQANDPITNPIEMGSQWQDVLQKLKVNKKYIVLFKKAFGTDMPTKAHVLKALAQFERIILSFNSKFDAYYFEGDATALSEQEARGLDIFFGIGNCNHCHSDVLLTDYSFRNNGLDSDPDSAYARTTHLATDIGKFKVPTLRNIALTAPYMHDGRFKTLEEVVQFYNSGIKAQSTNIDIHMQAIKAGLQLTLQQQADLVAFLKALTDSSFVNNKAFR